MTPYVTDNCLKKWSKRSSKDNNRRLEENLNDVCDFYLGANTSAISYRLANLLRIIS